MGCNATAKLAYGIDIGEYGDAFLDGVEFNDLVAELAGLKRPAASDYKDPAWTEYWRQKRDAAAAFPVELVHHSSHDYPCYAIVVNGTLQQADWGNPVKLKPQEVTPEQMQALKDFCAEHNLEGEPAWLLMAVYG